MNNEEMPERQLARYNTRRSSVGSAHKPYEHMLLKELPGSFKKIAIRTVHCNSISSMCDVH